MPIDSDTEIERLLLDTEQVVVIGASTTAGKAAHDVPAYLKDQGYDIVPVNPFADTVLDIPAYDSLADVPGPIALVDVFRPSDEVAEIVDVAIDRGDVEAIWLQLEIHDDEAVARAEEAGIAVVQDRCMKVAHRSLVG